MNKKIHAVRVFGLCRQKGSELPDDDPQKKYKGRFVLQGNDVLDELGVEAEFEELGTNPSNMESSRFVDFYGLLDGHSIETNEGMQAYTQDEFKDVTIETWLRLDRDFRPTHSDNYRDPVVPHEEGPLRSP